MSPMSNRRELGGRSIQSVTILGLSHVLVNELIFKFFDLISIWLKIDVGPIIWTIGFDVFIDGIHSGVIGREDGFFKEETKGWHFRYEDDRIFIKLLLGEEGWHRKQWRLRTSVMMLFGVPVRAERTKLDIIFRWKSFGQVYFE